MTLLQALELSVTLWRWLVDNFPASKNDFQSFDLDEYVAQCPMCEYYNNDCKICALKSCFDDSDYDIWFNYVHFNIGTKTRARAAAKRILKKLEKAYKEELEKEK